MVIPLPKSKLDIESAEQTVNLGYPAVEPYLDDLFQWLQDGNWPVAQILGPFLAEIGLPIIPYVNKVLSSDDDIWKYWVLSFVVDNNSDIAWAIRDTLERLSTSPFINEKAEGVDELAGKILEKLDKEKTDKS